MLKDWFGGKDKQVAEVKVVGDGSVDHILADMAAGKVCIHEGAIVTSLYYRKDGVTYISSRGETQCSGTYFASRTVTVDAEEWALYLSNLDVVNSAIEGLNHVINGKGYDWLAVRKTGGRWLFTRKGGSQREECLMYILRKADISFSVWLKGLMLAAQLNVLLTERVTQSKVSSPLVAGDIVRRILLCISGDTPTIVYGEPYRVEWVYSKQEIMMRCPLQGSCVYADIVVSRDGRLETVFSGDYLTEKEEQLLWSKVNR